MLHTVWPRPIRDPRLSFVPPRRGGSRLVPLDRKTRHGKKNFSQFSLLLHHVYRDRDGGRRGEAVIGPATEVCKRDERASWSRSRIRRAYDEPECRTIGNPGRFFHYHERPGYHRASHHPEVNASTLNPAAPSVDPASGQALALRRWTNWVCSVF